MSFLALKSPLTANDRIQRRRLIFADTLALVTLFAITALLAVMTNYLYQSYASHQVELANRWLARGEQAMRDGKPRPRLTPLAPRWPLPPATATQRLNLPKLWPPPAASRRRAFTSIRCSKASRAAD